MTEDTKAQAMLMYRRGWSCAGISRELKEDPVAVRSYIASMTVGIGKKSRRPIEKQKIVVPFEIPDYAPICNATATGKYEPAELNYRGKK